MQIPEEIRGLKVLVVDDDRDLAETLCDQLESAGMCIAGLTGDPLEAMQLASAANPDLIIMDIKFTDSAVDGIDIAQRINQRDPKPILFLSAYSEDGMIRRAKETGAITYLVKPVDLEKMLPSIVLTLERFRELTSLRAYVDSMNEDAENHRAIERAKRLLMKRGGINEEEAYEHLRRRSQAENCPIADIARAIQTS